MIADKNRGVRVQVGPTAWADRVQGNSVQEWLAADRNG
jgi:hypothetical protein